MVQKIEAQFKSYIRDKLKAEFGDSESGWWAKGIPEQMRINLHSSREQYNTSHTDRLAEGPYERTTLIQLSDIIQKNWPLFEGPLREASRKFDSKKGFLSLFRQLNDIRNDLSHTRGQQLDIEDSSTFLHEFGSAVDRLVE